MVTGLERFKEYFRDFQNDYILIGGVACELIFNSLHLEFRFTTDFDIVVVSENIRDGFGAKLKQFIRDGGYEVEHRKSNNNPTFFRFVNPKNAGFPKMLELASNKPAEDWAYHFSPLDIGDEKSSLSAILFEDDYYSFIYNNRVVIDGISVISSEGMIPLKALAFEELLKIKKPTNKNLFDLEKHLMDIFQFANILPGTHMPLPSRLTADLNKTLHHIRQRGLSDEQLELEQNIRRFYGLA
jgi:hypothetical protein